MKLRKASSIPYPLLAALVSFLLTIVLLYKPTPIDMSDPVYHGADAPADAVPGGARPVEELPQDKQASQPARYDLLPLDE